MLRKLITAAAALALGGAAAFGIAACGEDRGSLRIEGGTSTGKSGTGSSGSGTSTAAEPKTTTSP